MVSEETFLITRITSHPAKSSYLQLILLQLNSRKNISISGAESDMCEFKARIVAFEVQKNFANKFFSNKTVAKSLIDEKSGNLLDNLYLLLYVFVSKINI